MHGANHPVKTGIDMVVQWKVRHVYLLIDRRSGDAFGGLPPIEIRFTLGILHSQTPSYNEILDNHSKTLLQRDIEDFMSKYPEDKLGDFQYLATVSVPIYAIPVSQT